MPGQLTTLYQHYIHFKGENELYETLYKDYIDKLSGQRQEDYINEVIEGKKASEEEAGEYIRRIKKNSYE